MIDLDLEKNKCTKSDLEEISSLLLEDEETDFVVDKNLISLMGKKKKENQLEKLRI